ncbi:MAG: sigma-70 family RNA polymerase sigma factor [Firmicutes bacterium]|nr:sigma-70 family RNA polymerase sigma factor [Bacillota bacterium]
MEIIEKDLIRKSQKGDIEAFEQLIESYQKKVFNIALGMMGNYDDANDISQEVFIKVFKSIRNFRQQSSFSTWLYRITTNACLDELRKRKNSKNIISIDQVIHLENGEVVRQIEDDGPTPESTAERNELKEAVRDAIFQLSNEHKEVIILRDIQGFSYDDIAKIISCPQGTVKSRINRARNMLKEILKSKMELWDKDYVK